MRFVVTGHTGQLGTCLVERLRASDRDTLVGALGREELDLADDDRIDRAFERFRADPPDVLINAAAYTKVDQCESERALAMRINGEAPGRLADRCEDAGIRLLHVSTDYVFDGEGTEPYPVDAPTGPKTVYGATKLAGEQAVLARAPDSCVVRTSWVFGPGHNFVATMLRLARAQRSGEAERGMRVVDDQRGCPTYAADLAEGLIALARAGGTGVFHLSNAEPTTWWDFAREILDRCGYADVEIARGKTAELNYPAPRPHYSVLDCSRAEALGVKLRSWRDALVDYLATPHGRAIQRAA